MSKYTTAIAIVLAMGLSACGSSSPNSTAPAKPVTPTPTTPTQPTTPPEVHAIKPENVPAYINNFKQQIAQVQLVLDNKSSNITFVDQDQEQNLFILKYDKGVIFAGFDFSKEQGTQSLTLFEGDTALLASREENALQQFISTASKRLTSHEISNESEGENSIYTGTVKDEATQGIFSIRLVINEALTGAGDSTLEVQGERALLNGNLGSQSYIQFQELIANHPQVKTVELQNVPGSVNDDINVHTGRLVRDAGLNTLIKANGQAHSGGVDLFAAGVKRTLQTGGILGVHSWCCEDGKGANQLPKDHSAHGTQLTYYRKMLGTELGPEFYYFTINAADHDKIHHMTKAEMQKYQLVTDFLD